MNVCTLLLHNPANLNASFGSASPTLVALVLWITRQANAVGHTSRLVVTGGCRKASKKLSNDLDERELLERGPEGGRWLGL